MKIALTLLLLLCAVPVWAAPVPFIDVNCNGVFDAGDEALDVGVPGSPPRSLVIITEECLVVPYAAWLDARQNQWVSCRACDGTGAGAGA